MKIEEIDFEKLIERLNTTNKMYSFNKFVEIINEDYSVSVNGVNDLFDISNVLISLGYQPIYGQD